MSWNQKLFKNLLLQNQRVRLITLHQHHIPQLAKNGLDPAIWHTPLTTRNTDLDSFNEQYDWALEDLSNQKQVPFVVEDRETQQLIGGTRFYNIDEKNKNISIGYTWLIPSNQRNGVNRHNKFLLLRFAFEELGVQRLQFDINATNLQSRTNVEGIGAKLEGILRSNTVCIDLKNSTDQITAWKRRDSCVYSILQNEWDLIKQTKFKDFSKFDL